MLHSTDLCCDTRSRSASLLAALSEHRQRRFETQLKLFEINLSIAINVKPSQNRNQFMLGGHMSCTTQKPFEIILIQIPVGPIIYCLECFLKGKVVRAFETSLHLVSFEMEPNFLEK